MSDLFNYLAESGSVARVGLTGGKGSLEKYSSNGYSMPDAVVYTKAGIFGNQYAAEITNPTAFARAEVQAVATTAKEEVKAGPTADQLQRASQVASQLANNTQFKSDGTSLGSPEGDLNKGMAVVQNSSGKGLA